MNKQIPHIGFRWLSVSAWPTVVWCRSKSSSGWHLFSVRTHWLCFSLVKCLCLVRSCWNEAENCEALWSSCSSAGLWGGYIYQFKQSGVARPYLVVPKARRWQWKRGECVQGLNWADSLWSWALPPNVQIVPSRDPAQSPSESHHHMTLDFLYPPVNIAGNGSWWAILWFRL